MSCFIVSKVEVSALSWFVMSQRKPRGGIHYYELFNVASELSFYNVQRVNARYKEKNKRYKFNQFDFSPDLDFKAISVAQMAKTIDCYLYQTNEHPRYDKLPLLAELQSYRDLLVFDSVDYDSSVWGLDSIPLKELKEFEPDFKTSRFSGR